MNGKYVLDTNIVIALFDQEPAVLEKVAAAEMTLVPITAIGELFHGAFGSRRASENLKRIELLTQAHSIPPIDLDTARHYGTIRCDLRGKGRPIPENDVWIAAIARQYGATVATRDRHFEAVQGLSIAYW